MEIYAPLAAPPRHLGDEVAAGGPRLPLPAAGAVQARRRDARGEARRPRAVRRPRSAQVLRDELAKHGIKAEVHGRAKHIYSIYKKIEKYAADGRDVDEIYDLLAVRVIVDTVTDCYTALGVVHGLWQPLPGTFDDYIANPKESMYQSLHTTVMALERAAARGADPHVRDAPDRRVRHRRALAVQGGRQAATRRYEERLAWLRQLLDWQRDIVAGGGVRRVGEDGHLPGPGLRLHAEGRDQGHAGRQHAARLRLPHPHRPRAPVRRREGERAAGVAQLPR